MSFVTIDDFELRYENTVPAADVARVEALLGDACDLAMDVIGKTYADGATVPSILTAKVCEAVRRAYDNPSGLQGETIGDYSWRGSSGGSASAGVYFTPAEIRIMRRAAGRSGAGAIELEGDFPQQVTDEQYLADAGSPTEPVLYFSTDDLLT